MDVEGGGEGETVAVRVVLFCTDLEAFGEAIVTEGEGDTACVLVTVAAAVGETDDVKGL